MANEISKSMTVTVNKNGQSITVTHTNSTITMTGTVKARLTVATTTSWAALSIPSSLTGELHLLIRNMDSTNYVQFAVDSGGSNIFAKLLFGESCEMARIPAVPYVRANTAAVNLDVLVYQA